MAADAGLLAHDADVAAEAMAAEARLARRADRARLLTLAIEAILLGHDDDERIAVTGLDPVLLRALPGMR